MLFLWCVLEHMHEIKKENDKKTDIETKRENINHII